MKSANVGGSLLITIYFYFLISVYTVGPVCFFTGLQGPQCQRLVYDMPKKTFYCIEKTVIVKTVTYCEQDFLCFSQVLVIVMQRFQKSRVVMTSVISNVPLAPHASRLRERECFRFLKVRLHSCHTGATDDFAAGSLSRLSKLLKFPPPPRVVELSRLLILSVFISLFPPHYVIYAPPAPESFAHNHCIQFHQNAMPVGALSHDGRASVVQVRHQPYSSCVLCRGVKYCRLVAML